MKDIYLRFHVSPDTSEAWINSPRTTSEITIDIIYREGMEPRWFSDTYSEESGYADLQLHAYMSSDMGESKVYGERMRYFDRRYIDEGDLQRMAKTMSRIRRAMDRIEKSEGYAQDFSEMASRFARAVRAKGYAQKNSKERAEMSGQEWRWGTTAELRNEVAHAIYMFQRNHSKDAA